MEQPASFEEALDYIARLEKLNEAMSNALHQMLNECTCKLADAHRELIEAQKKAE